MMDHDQLLKQGPKRKGDALSEDTTELWEKEKRSFQDQWRLLSSPTGSNESYQLELSRVWEPSDS